MVFRLLADTVVSVHAAFVLFVIFGGLSVLRWRPIAWAHLAAVAWGASLEFAGWICPLTPLENELRRRAGEAGYTGGFVEHYVLRALYPGGLTPTVQFALGVSVIVINAVVYSYVWRARRAAADGDQRLR